MSERSRYAPGSVDPGSVDAAPADAQAASVLENMLARGPGKPRTGTVTEAEVVSWAESLGSLDDGHAARLATACLLCPMAGDRVLVWTAEDGERWVLSVLHRPGDSPASVLSAPGPLTIKSPRVAVVGAGVHIHAEEFLTSTRRRHAVEHTRTEIVDLRVADVGTDVRRASNATDSVGGTLLQRTGVWISNTVREARLHARAFLFD